MLTKICLPLPSRGNPSAGIIGVLHQLLSSIIFLYCPFWHILTIKKFSYPLVKYCLCHFYFPEIISQHPFKSYLHKIIERNWKQNNIWFFYFFLFFLQNSICRYYIELKNMLFNHVHVTWMVNALVFHELNLVPWYFYSLNCPYML